MKLHETVQFNPIKKNVTLLLDAYGLELIDFNLANSGIENCTVLVTTTTGAFVLRIYRQGKKADIAILQEVNFTRFLQENGLPVAVALPTITGEYISHLQESGTTWQAILMKHSLGEHAEHYSELLISELAQIQAHMHLLAANYRSNDNNDGIKLLKGSHFIPMIVDRDQLSTDRKRFIDRAETYQVLLDEELPRGLCHLDFDNGNVLSRDDVVTAILDFDDLMLAPYVMCLAYTLWDVVFDGGLQEGILYINWYTKLRKLNEIEKRSLVKIMLFRHYVIGCNDIADNHMDDTLLRHYLELESELLNPQNSLFLS